MSSEPEQLASVEEVLKLIETGVEAPLPVFTFDLMTNEAESAGHFLGDPVVVRIRPNHTWKNIQRIASTKANIACKTDSMTLVVIRASSEDSALVELSLKNSAKIHDVLRSLDGGDYAMIRALGCAE